MQYFKGDDLEIQMDAVAQEICDLISLQKDLFFEDAYNCASLGDLIYENNWSPLANAIDQTIYRSSFPEIFEAFIAGGSFESYLTVFRKIFGDNVTVLFNADNLTTPDSPPGPGKLNIEITAAGNELSDFLARRIVSEAYVYDEVVDHDGANIVFQTVKGFQTQYELDQMLFEMVPAGIFTQITFSTGA